MPSRSTLVAALTLTLAAGLAVAQDTSSTSAAKPGAQPARNPQPSPMVSATPAERENWPKIAFDNTDHDFGMISDDNPVSHEFKFTNTGKTDLEIGNIVGSCGCTVPALEKKTYAPGESGTIKVTYNPHNKQGPQHTTVTVNSNDPASPVQVLNVRSAVKAIVSLDRIVTLGNVERGQSARQTISFVSRIAGLGVASATSNNPRTTVTVQPTTESQQDGDKVWITPIEVNLVDASAIGQVQDTITLRTTDEKRPVLTCTVSAEIVGELLTTPRALSISGKNPGERINAKIVVQSRKEGHAFDAPTVRTEAAQGPDLFTYEVRKEQDSNTTTYVIDVIGTAPTNPGAFRGDVVISTKVAGEESVKVPYFGFVRGPSTPAPVRAPGGVSDPRGMPTTDPWSIRPSSLLPH